MTPNWKEHKGAAEWLPILNAAEQRLGIPHDLLARQCYEESHFDPAAHNPSSAIGLMQLLPKYFPGAGEDGAKDIDTGGRYLRDLHKRFLDWQLALAAYNWGPGSVNKWLKAKKLFSAMPKETQDYVTEIIGDVPVEGALCKIPSQGVSQPAAGPLPSQPTVEPPSASPSPKSWWRSATSFFTTHLPQSSALQSPPSALLQQVTSSPTADAVSQQETSMSNPAAPALIAALQALNQFIDNLGTDPAQVVVKFPGALSVLLGQLEMQLPAVASAELGSLQTSAKARIAALITQLQQP